MVKYEASENYAKEYMEYMKENYSSYSDSEKKKIRQFLIDSVELFEDKKEDGRQVKNVRFKFPVLYKGSYGQEIGWDTERHVDRQRSSCSLTGHTVSFLRISCMKKAIVWAT